MLGNYGEWYWDTLYRDTCTPQRTHDPFGKVVERFHSFSNDIYIYIYLGCGSLPVTVTTKIITCSVGDPHKTFIYHCYWEGATPMPLWSWSSSPYPQLPIHVCTAHIYTSQYAIYIQKYNLHIFVARSHLFIYICALVPMYMYICIYI